MLVTTVSLLWLTQGFAGGSDSKESACNMGDLGLIPGLGRSPGECNGNPLQYSCLENPMDGGVWWSTVHGVAKETDMTERLHFHIHTLGLPWWLSGQESTCQCRRHRFNSWVRKLPWRRKWQPTSVFLPGKPMDRGAWWATIHRVAQSQTQLKRLSMHACMNSVYMSIPISQVILLLHTVTSWLSIRLFSTSVSLFLLCK